ncbi:hypothetical protein B0T20DRAFT_350048 [Sordaria brevicollis]|uniref:Nuclear pore protein n=1 Tax=Sordaria brevicollis TaxID=83679 RepID=A0AAE0PHS9_SORBR|nr:hypothetical protein B0T20DRAFT_350048 [Sordaria brevicollis]
MAALQSSNLETVYIDPNGDLLIDATANPICSTRFRVCSNALRRQSPVWEKMLFGPWKEAKPTDGSPWIVELPDDPDHSLHIIFDIIHANYEGIPPFPSVIIIYDLMTVAHKYDVVHLTRPWSSQWSSIASNSILPAADVVRSLFIAWELGDEHLFALRLEEIALQVEVDLDGRLVYGKDIFLEEVEHLGPLDVLGKFGPRRDYSGSKKRWT